MDLFGQKWLYSGKSGCNRTNLVVFGEKWLYLCKSGCNWRRWLYSGKMFVLGQKSNIWAN